MYAIRVKKLVKQFEFKMQSGLKGFLRPTKKQVTAVNEITFDVKKGETIAFIGPNGAGKSTTIKMLTGILQPTSGNLEVLGIKPIEQRRELAMRIGTVFGQRSQLVFNLPLTDSFWLTAHMYRVAPDVAETRIKELIKSFDLADFADQPVRKLSLGQRMRAEVANALIHNPDIIFLDEPTIGLDVVAKRSLREVLKKVNKEQGTTIFLTSHDVGDIEEICDRTVIVNHGEIMLDAKTSHLKKQYLKSKTISVVAEDAPATWKVGALEANEHDGRYIFDVDTTKHKLGNFIQKLFEDVEVSDITIEDTPLEDIIHEIYTTKKT